MYCFKTDLKGRGVACSAPLASVCGNHKMLACVMLNLIVFSMNYCFKTLLFLSEMMYANYYKGQFTCLKMDP